MKLYRTVMESVGVFSLALRFPGTVHVRKIFPTSFAIRDFETLKTRGIQRVQTFSIFFFSIFLFKKTFYFRAPARWIRPGSLVGNV